MKTYDGRAVANLDVFVSFLGLQSTFYAYYFRLEEEFKAKKIFNFNFGCCWYGHFFFSFHWGVDWEIVLKTM